MIIHEHMTISDLIDIAGDGEIPYYLEPFLIRSTGCTLMINSGLVQLKWSDLKDVLWGLREYMIVQGHFFELSFAIKRGREIEAMGSGYVSRRYVVTQATE